MENGEWKRCGVNRFGQRSEQRGELVRHKRARIGGGTNQTAGQDQKMGKGTHAASDSTRFTGGPSPCPCQ